MVKTLKMFQNRYFAKRKSLIQSNKIRELYFVNALIEILHSSNIPLIYLPFYNNLKNIQLFEDDKKGLNIR